MSDTQQTSTPIKSAATRARLGAAAVIAQYIQDLSGARASLANPASTAPAPCAP
jgi:hypothetical protein